jgi:nucleotide-binding universal stress UspA family protein
MRIIVPYDFGPASEKALAWAANLKTSAGALPLHVIHVVNPLPVSAPDMVVVPALSERDIAELRGRLGRAVQKTDASASSEVILAPSTGRAIIDAARRLEADLIAMGTHGRAGLSRLMLGSVAEYVVRHASCPVLTVRAAPPEVAQ